MNLHKHTHTYENEQINNLKKILIRHPMPVTVGRTSNRNQRWAPMSQYGGYRKTCRSWISPSAKLVLGLDCQAFLPGPNGSFHLMISGMAENARERVKRGLVIVISGREVMG